jgi:CrcB protein
MRARPRHGISLRHLHHQHFRLHRHGLIAGYLAFKGEASQHWRLFLMTGILGGYTTFSAFSLDAALLYERGEIGLALFYVVGSVVFSIGGLFAGLALVRHFS